MIKKKFFSLVIALFLSCMSSAYAYDLIETSWPNIKTFKTRDTFSLSFISFAQGTSPETYQYQIYGADTAFFFKTTLTDTNEIADFEGNFKSSASEIGSQEEAIANSKIPFSQTGSLTSNSTSSLQTVLSYTVPTKKTLHLQQWMVGRLNTGNAEMTIAQLQVNGTLVDGQSQQALQGTTFIEHDYAHPLPVANAGDVITIKITPTALQSTTFGARIIGELR